MGLLPGVGGVAGPVQVQEHAVGAGPVRHRMQRGIADGEVDHDDDAAEFFREFGALVHVLHGGRGDVQVMALDLAGLLGGAIHRLHDEQVPVAPAHERLGIDVLVVLGEIQAAAQRLVHDPAVVAGTQAELRLGRGAEQRAAVLVQVLAFGDDAVRGASEGFHVMQGDPQVLQAQRFEGLEAEHVADDRGRQVGDRALFEQVDVVGDVRDVLAVPARHREHPVALGLVVLVGGEPVGPHHGPRRGRGFPGHRGARLLRGDAGLRRDPEGGQDIGGLRLVIGLVIAHLGVGDDPGIPPVCRHVCSSGLPSGAFFHHGGESVRRLLTIPAGPLSDWLIVLCWPGNAGAGGCPGRGSSSLRACRPGVRRARACRAGRSRPGRCWLRCLLRV